MKTLGLILGLFFSLGTVLAQNSNMIVFSEQGEAFYLIVNGVRQNSSPQTNVKMTGLNADSYKVKIVFQNENLPEFDKNIFFHTKGLEYTYAVKLNRKGVYTLRFVSEAQLSEALAAPPAQAEIVYTTVEAPLAETSATVITTSTTTTTTTNNDPNVNMQMNVNDQEMGVNVSMNVSGMDANTTSQTYTETTTVTTISSTSYTEDATDTYEEVVYVEGYNGNIGCNHPMSSADYQSAKRSIASKSFEDSKLTLAKQIADANCLTSEQVKGILKVFTFEDSKLEFAKYSYSHTYDVGNYYKINDAFQFESTIEELDEYIRK
jgi:hypothetical protein